MQILNSPCIHNEKYAQNVKTSINITRPGKNSVWIIRPSQAKMVFGLSLLDNQHHYPTTNVITRLDRVISLQVVIIGLDPIISLYRFRSPGQARG